MIASQLGSSPDLMAQPSRSTAQRAFGGIQPSLSPDGSMIALSMHGAIARMPREGGVLTRLTGTEGWDLEPSWSPDGKRIAFVSSPGLDTGLLQLIDAQSGERVPLPSEIFARGRALFHPNGDRLLGLFAVSGQPHRLQWCELASGTLSMVAIAPFNESRRARMKWTLTADGSKIVLATFQEQPGQQDGNDGPSADLWTVSSIGGEPTQFARWPNRIYGMCSDASGRGVFVVTDRGSAHNDIWHIPLENSLKDARKITFGQADEDWPSVSADGKWLAHTENQEGATALARIDLTAGRRETLALDRVEFRQPAGRLRLIIKDANGGQPLTARISVRKEGGQFHFPLGSMYRVTGGVGHFYASHEAELDVPAGRVAVQAWHGPEYKVHRRSVDVTAGATLTIEVSLERWVDMPGRGWYSGENHIHANYGYGAWHNGPATMRDQCQGEDLHIANLVVANSDGDGVFDRAYFLGRPDPLSSARSILYWNEEFRSTIWGHMTLGNLSQLVEPIFTGFKETTNPWDMPTNADIAERARQQLGTVSYTHPASNPESPYDGAYSAKGLPMDAALGRIDTLDVMGFGYAASLKLWYRLLNCGFRLPAAAGTDVFLNRISSYPPGWGRCYVRLTNGLDYTSWMLGQKAGRSFITTGPMIEWTANGSGPGDTLRPDSASRVRVRARVSAQFPLTTLELIQNGVVVRTKIPISSENELTLDESVEVTRSGWLAVRCKSGNPQSSFPGGAELAAHGNPIYVEMRGQPLDSRSDADYFLAWIDRLEADLNRRDRIPNGIDHVAMQLNAARSVYRKLRERHPSP